MVTGNVIRSSTSAKVSTGGGGDVVVSIGSCVTGSVPGATFDTVNSRAAKAGAIVMTQGCARSGPFASG